MIKRDGSKTSLWQSSSEFVARPITLSSSYDVVIVGGGMTGVTTALLLQKAGKKCLLLEAFNLGFGTTGGTTAHLNTLLDTPYYTISKNFGEGASKIVAKAATEAIKLIETNIAHYNIECEFKTTVAYLYAQDKKESDELEDICKSGKDAGVEMDFISTMPLSVPYVKVLKVEGQAKFHPLKYLFSLASNFEELGGHILTGCKVEEAKHNDHSITVQTTNGSIYTTKIIYATHIPPGINLLHLRCAPWRSYAMAIKLENEQYPSGLIYDMKDPYHFFRSQLIDGEPYLIAGGKDHKTGDEKNTKMCLTKLLAHVKSIFPVKEVTHEWSSQYFESSDGLPYIGVLPGKNDSFYVATGFGGNGMIYSHVAAKELTSLITNQHSLFDNLFSPSRVKPVAGFANFIDHNKDVVKHFIGKYFGVDQLDELAGLAPGDGKVVKINSAHVAVSKDLNGKVHAVSAVCTHMKCDVAWNDTEQSWDCPCHGARYSREGKVITGPACYDLEEVSLTEPVKLEIVEMKV